VAEAVAMAYWVLVSRSGLWIVACGVSLLTLTMWLMRLYMELV